MRVLLLSNMYPSSLDPGYGSFVARQQQRLTSDHGIDFSLVVSARRGGRWANIGKYARLLGSTIAATIRGDYDIVHAHYLLPTAAFALLPALARRRPLVITAHGTDIYTGQRPFWKGLVTRALRRAHRVIVVSEFLGRELEAGYGVRPRGGVLVSDMGVDTALFTPGDRDTAKAARGLPAGVPHVLFVGNLVEAKGVADLATALVSLAAREADFRATFVGGGPMLAELQRITQPIRDRVAFAGVLPHHALVDVFRSADLFVLPSHREGLGLVCLEAFACGIPVVAARSGGIPEIVEDGVNGALIEPGDRAALTDALERLLGDAGLRSRLAATARETALKHDEAAQATRVAQVYADAFGSR